jgi:hypothetical protein
VPQSSYKNLNDKHLFWKEAVTVLGVQIAEENAVDRIIFQLFSN